MDERTEAQRAILEYIEGGGSTPVSNVLEDLEDEYGPTTIRVEFAKLVEDGAIQEHPNFKNSYVLSNGPD